MRIQNRQISGKQQKLYAEIERNNANNLFAQYHTYLETLAGNDNLTIIDIGGGSGHFSNKVKTFFNENDTNTSINVIDYCKYDDWSLFSEINFIEESAFTALEKFQDNSVDVIFLNSILHHLIMDTYEKTRKTQEKLIEITYRKIRENGLVFVKECYYQNFILRDFSTPIVYFMTTSKLPFMTKLSSKLGSKSAGVGVCFLSPKAWRKVFSDTEFIVVNSQENILKWVRYPLIQEQFFSFVLTKAGVANK